MSDKVLVCPRCGSTQVQVIRSEVAQSSGPLTYCCEAVGCGYSGSVCPELDVDDVERFQLAIKQASMQ